MRSFLRFVALVLFVGMLFLLAHNRAYADSCTSSGSGDWSAISWSCGHTPTSGDDGITVNGTFNNGSKTLTANTSGPYLTNHGTFNGQTGKYVFAGSGTGGVYGSVATTFNDVDISIGVDFKGSGAPDNATVNGTLTIKSGGFVSANAPYYATGSTLKYDTGGFYQAGAEWKTGATSGSGVPYHVQVSTTSTHLNFQNSSGATRTALGNITIDSGTTFSLSNTGGGGNLALKGNWTNNGTFNADSRSVTFNGSSTQNLGGSSATTFSDLTIDTGATAQLTTGVAPVINNTITINGDLYMPDTVTVTNDGAATITLGSAGTIHTEDADGVTGSASTSFGLNFSHSSIDTNGTVVYNRSGAQTITARTYQNLTTAGSGTKSLSSGGTTINSTLTIRSGTTLDVLAIQPTVQGGGSIVVNGTLDFSNSSGFIQSGTSGTTTLTMGSGGWIKTVDSNGLGPDSNASLQTQSGGAWNTTSVSTNGTIEYYRTSAQTITDRDYNHLTITNTGTKTWAPSSTRTINGNLTIGTSAPLTMSGSQTVNLKGNFSNSGTFTAGTGTITFNGSGTQNLTANNSTTFNNLTVNSGVTLVETVSADNATASGTLTNNGTIRKSQSVSGTGSKTFGLAGAYNGANLTINVTTQGTLSNVQVDRIDSNHPNANTAQQTGRYWSITPTGSGYTANLTLPRSNSGAPSVCKHVSGSTWSCASNSNNTNDVTRNGITSFSDWAVGNDAPTSAGLVSFKAKLTPKNKVKVKWETGNESNVFGFNLYRQPVGSKKWVKLNGDVPIDAQNIGKPEGALYTFVDKKVQSGKTYRYKLEVLKTSEPSEWSEVVKVAVP